MVLAMEGLVFGAITNPVLRPLPVPAPLNPSPYQASQVHRIPVLAWNATSA